MHLLTTGLVDRIKALPSFRGDHLALFYSMIPSRLFEQIKVKITLMHTDLNIYTHFGALFKVNISHSEKRKESTYTGHENKPNLDLFLKLKSCFYLHLGQARLRN